jgi:hypothetical protein
LLTEGAVLVALGIVLAVLAGGLAIAAAVIPFLMGARWLARGTTALRLIEEGPARARQLNA